jgi:chromosome segregation ATPase
VSEWLAQVTVLKKENQELGATSAMASSEVAEKGAKLGELGSQLETLERQNDKLKQQLKRLEREKDALPTPDVMVSHHYSSWQ